MDDSKEKTGVTFNGSVTFNGPMFDIHDNEHVHIGVEGLNSKMQQNKARGKKHHKKMDAKPHEAMTFKRSSNVLKEHLILLFQKLTKEKWIDGNEVDFKAFFSGKRDEECVLTWRGVYGKSTLVELFRQLTTTGLVIVPEGYTIPSILEGHFKDKDGEWLTGLDKGDRANKKALSVIEECVRLLKTDIEVIKNGYFGEENDFKSEYDPYDHQDLNLHKY